MIPVNQFERPLKRCAAVALLLCSCAAPKGEVILPNAMVSVPSGVGWAPGSSFDMRVAPGERVIRRGEDRRLLLPLAIEASRETESTAIEVSVTPVATLQSPAPSGAEASDLSLLAESVAEEATRRDLRRPGTVLGERDAVVLVDGRAWSSRVRFDVGSVSEAREAGRFEVASNANSVLAVEGVSLVAERAGRTFRIPASYLAEGGGVAAVDLESLGIDACGSLRAIIEGQLSWSVAAVVRWRSGGAWSEKAIEADGVPLAAGDSTDIVRVLRDAASRRLRQLSREAGSASLSIAFVDDGELRRGEDRSSVSIRLTNEGGGPISRMRSRVAAALDGSVGADGAMESLEASAIEIVAECLCPGDALEIEVPVEIDPCGGADALVVAVEGTAFPQFRAMEARIGVAAMDRPEVRVFQATPDGGETIAVVRNDGGEAASGLMIEVFDANDPSETFAISLPPVPAGERLVVRRGDLSAPAAVGLWDRLVSERARVTVRAVSQPLQQAGCGDSVLHEPPPFEL